MIHDSLGNWPIYFNTSPWKRVFEFIHNLSSDSPENKHIDLAGADMYATVMSYPTCEPAESVLESHDTYIDIQVSLQNSEAIDWYPRNGLRIKTEYDPDRDRTLYHRPGPAPARINNFPGFFTVLFPEDAHMPKLITGGTAERVKKVVVKLNLRSLTTK